MKQESKQDEATVEQPEVASEETTKETPEITSTETKATSEKQRTEEEFRKLQGHMTRAINEAKAKDTIIQSVQSELQELRNDMERERLENQRKQLDALSDDPDAQKKLMAKFDLDKERREFEAHQKREREGMSRAWNQAADLVKEYNLSPADASDLLNAESPKEMELMAKLKSAEQTKVETPEKETGETFAPDSNKSDAGGDSDEAFLKRWNAGDEPVTKESLERARKLVNK